MTDFKKTFGENLKKIRKIKNITQEKLAEQIDVHCRQMSKIETGENFPSSKTLEKLCIALQVTPSVLFDFEFQLEAATLNTGTGSTIAYYKAIQQDNLIILQNHKGENIPSSTNTFFDSENRLKDIANKTNKALTVEYFKDGSRTKTMIYKPDGKVEQLTNSNPLANDLKNELESLLKSIDNNEEYLDFIKLAIKSIKDDRALEQLGYLINGIKIARKIK